jgi:hypothetical protein
MNRLIEDKLETQEIVIEPHLQQKLQQNDTGKMWIDSGRLVNGY